MGKILGAALMVGAMLALIFFILSAVIAPAWEKVAYYNYQIQLSQERMSNGNNTTKIILGGFFGLSIVIVGGYIFYLHDRGRVYDLEQRRLEVEARLRLAEIKADAYRLALRESERRQYSQIPEETYAVVRRR